MNETSTCSTCRFWKPRDEPGTGKCRWGPPIYLPSGPNGPARSAWPTTPANEFCFRHESYLPAVRPRDPLAPLEPRSVVTMSDEVLTVAPEGVKSVAPETPPADEVKAAPAAPAVGVPAEIALQPVASAPHPESPTTPTPEQVESARGAVPKLFDNQIGQLVRGKRQPGQRIE